MIEGKYKQFVTDPEDALPYIEYLKYLADYQFGAEVGNCLFGSNKAFKIQRSVNTWRIRNVLSEDGLFLVLRPQDGLFSLTLASGVSIKECLPSPKLRVIVKDEVASVILEEGNVFAKHVKNVDKSYEMGTRR